MTDSSKSAHLADALSPRVIACVAGVWSTEDSYCLPLPMAAGVIRESGTRVLVLHAPHPALGSARAGGEGLAIQDLVQALGPSSGEMVVFVNSSLCSSLKDVQRIARLIPEIRVATGSTVAPVFLKLEILDERRRPMDSVVLSIVGELGPSIRSICIPYLQGSAESVRRAADLGCPAVRIWCSDIGTGSGVTDKVRLRPIVEASGVPLILEGGLSSADDATTALDLGFDAVLMNSAFRRACDPVALARAIRSAIDRQAQPRTSRRVVACTQ